MASSKKDLVAALMEMEEALNLRATESETLGAPEAALRKRTQKQPPLRRPGIDIVGQHLERLRLLLEIVGDPMICFRDHASKGTASRPPGCRPDAYIRVPPGVPGGRGGRWTPSRHRDVHSPPVSGRRSAIGGSGSPCGFCARSQLF